MDHKIDQVQKAVNEVSERVEERSLAMEILQELKQSSKRGWNAFFALLIVLVLTIGGFIWYLNQYDYTNTVDATGVYTAVMGDGSGTIIAQDVTPEQWELFMEWLNGQNKSYQDTN